MTPLKRTLSDAEIKLIADWHYAEMLHIDDEETREGTGRDEFMRSIAKQLDDAVVEYACPYHRANTSPPTACRTVSFVSVLAILSLRCQSCRPPSQEATSRKSMNILITC